MVHIIYKTTNNVNNYFYIGVHNNSDESYLGSGTYLKRAIGKYGRENFTRETLFEFDTIEEAYIKEAELVTESEVNNPKCYNVQNGGLGGVGRLVSEQTRRKMSKSAKARFKRTGSPLKNGHSEESKKKLSETRKAKGLSKGQNNPMYGKTQPSLSERNKLPKRWMHNGVKNRLALLTQVKELEAQGFEYGRL